MWKLTLGYGIAFFVETLYSLICKEVFRKDPKMIFRDC
jgi:hypothetical protein